MTLNLNVGQFLINKLDAEIWLYMYRVSNSGINVSDTDITQELLNQRKTKDHKIY